MKEAEEELAASGSSGRRRRPKNKLKLRDDARARSKDVMGFNSVFDQKKEVAKKEQLRRDKLTLQYGLDLQKARRTTKMAKLAPKENSTRGSRSRTARSSKVRTIVGVVQKVDQQTGERDRAFRRAWAARAIFQGSGSLQNEQQIRGQDGRHVKFSTSHYGAEIGHRGGAEGGERRG